MSKKKGEITPIIPKPANREYVERTKRVLTPIVADSPEFIPQYKTKGSACCDLRANLPPDPRGERKLTIAPGYTELVDCGFSIALPKGYEAQIRARSGLAAKGLICTNATEEQEGGTIDDDYRLRLKVILSNVGRSIITIEHMDRIAQMSVRPCWYFEFDPVDDLPESGDDRVGGFGSTGVK
jgi:dUTP pyrophosphatase